MGGQARWRSLAAAEADRLVAVAVAVAVAACFLWPPICLHPAHQGKLIDPLPTTQTCTVLQDAGLALRLLEEAARRLQQSIDFLRGTAEPFLALGDVLLERGEKLAALGDSSGSGSGSSGSSSAGGSGGDVQAAAACLQRALADGYQQAQRISAHNPEAAVGVGDVHVQLARLAAAGQHVGAAAEHWAAGEVAYRAALQQPMAFDFGERCDVRYNHACCLARCGRGQEAAALLRGLLALGAVSAASVAADADLAGVVLA